MIILINMYTSPLSPSLSLSLTLSNSLLNVSGGYSKGTNTSSPLSPKGYPRELMYWRLLAKRVPSGT